MTVMMKEIWEDEELDAYDDANDRFDSSDLMGYGILRYSKLSIVFAKRLSISLAEVKYYVCSQK